MKKMIEIFFVMLVSSTSVLFAQMSDHSFSDMLETVNTGAKVYTTIQKQFVSIDIMKLYLYDI